MGRRPLDLIGKRFGRLVVIRRIDTNVSRSCVWEVMCDCSKSAEVTSNHLSSGKVKSCGCLQNEVRVSRAKKNTKHDRNRDIVDMASKGVTYIEIATKFNITKERVGQIIGNSTGSRRKMGRERLDLTGKRFGKLVVKGMADFLLGQSTVCIVECDCGTIKNVRSRSLVNHDTTSCGCIKLNDLVGRRFDRLLVKERIGPNKWGNMKWKVECDCGNIKVVVGNNLVMGLTRSCGCLKRDLLKSRHTLNKT